MEQQDDDEFGLVDCWVDSPIRKQMMIVGMMPQCVMCISATCNPSNCKYDKSYDRIKKKNTINIYNSKRITQERVDPVIITTYKELPPSIQANLAHNFYHIITRKKQCIRDN